MTYTINQNTQYNSLEIYFDGKPSEAVRNVLKANKFRWHCLKGCWYGYGSEESIAAAITGTSTEEEPATVVGDGYLGGGSVYGSKSNHHLHGADLSAAIREDLKKAGIKGATVRCKTYSGGQSVTATVKISPEGYADRAAYIADWKFPCSGWCHVPEMGCMHGEHFYAIPNAARQEELRKLAAAYEYDRMTSQRQSVNHYRLADVDYLTKETRAKLQRIVDIISAYRYDNSNSMVDYFDTNFYYDIDVVPA